MNCLIKYYFLWWKFSWRYSIQLPIYNYWQSC